MMHKIKIEPISENCIHARVSIDGKPIRCSEYNIRHCVDQVPVAELKVCAVPDVEQETIVHVSNKEEIARLMDEEEFEEFCDIWNEVHGHEKKRRPSNTLQ